MKSRKTFKSRYLVFRAFKITIKWRLWRGWSGRTFERNWSRRS